GAIGCGYIGLRDDEIADTWLAFIPYSHYDGAEKWPYPGSDGASAINRMHRLKGRATFVCHEVSTEKARLFIERSGIDAPFVFEDLPFHNHNDAWVLRESASRQKLRKWLADVLENRPGTHSISGTVVDASGGPVAGATVSGGGTHWTTTDEHGIFS